jgi:TonB-dependent SusC/RagA subfamily outer membrane receptor
METVMIYLGKVSLAIAVFYTLYILLFRYHKQFRFNRLYLSGSLFLSFIIPLIKFTITRLTVRQMVILPDPVNEIGSAVSGSQAGIDILPLLLWLYFGVVILFSLRLVTGQLRAFSIIRRCRKAVIKGTRVFITEKDFYPFTFFSKIVISESSLSHPDLEMILYHEKVHANERHTLDILLSEVLFLFQWFNPLAWMHKEAVKNNLEFLADQIVVQQSDMQAYQMAIVSMAGKQGIARFLNALNGNDLKNRIIMMKKKTENRNKFVRQLAVLPLLVILILGLSNKEFKAAPVAEPMRYSSEPVKLSVGTVSLDTLKDKNKEITVIGYANSKTSKDTLKTQIKKDGSEVWVTVTDGQKPTNAIGINTGKTRNDEIQVIGYGLKKDSLNSTGDKIIIRATGNSQGIQPLYILDGSEIKSLDGISPDQIESISVLKNESAITLYGEKGKNGVILITSKKSKQPADDVLIILDGKETTKKVADLNPDEIQSVSVWKGDKATGKYGEKGKNGVIEITMKTDQDENPSTINTAQELRKSIAKSVRYPLIARENRQQGEVRIYAFVNDEGEITQITESKPKEECVRVDEVVIVAYDPPSDRQNSNNNRQVLNQEAALQIKKLPALNIPEFKNRWLVFQFKFMLQ